MFEKIEEFLYDFIGIIIPGFILIILGVVYFSVYDQTSSKNFTDSLKIWKSFEFIEKYFLIILLFIAYFTGHLIILLARFQYEICQRIMDFGLLKNWRTSAEHSSFFKKWLMEALTYHTKSYSPHNESIKKRTLELLSQKFSFSFQDNWYTIYKMSSIIITQDEVSSRVNNYFAKYTFFKSIAFIFWINQFLLLSMSFQYFTFSIIVISFINFLFWLTFHSSYKRYWTMCGDESLLTLFYYLNKQHNSLDL